MTKTRVREVGRFRVVDNNGKMHTIIARQDFIVADSAFQEPPREIPGLVSYYDTTGRGVNQIDENTYELFVGTQMVRTTKI